MTYSLREKILIMFAFTIVILYLYINLYLGFVTNKINFEKNNIKNINEQIVKLQEEESDIIDVNVDELYYNSTQIVPIQNNKAEILYDLESIINFNNIKVNSIDIQNIQIVINSDNIYKIPIKIEISGIYNDIINFVKSLETNKRYINIESFKIIDCNSEHASANVAIDFYCSLKK